MYTMDGGHTLGIKAKQQRGTAATMDGVNRNWEDKCHQ